MIAYDVYILKVLDNHISYNITYMYIYTLTRSLLISKWLDL